MSWKNLLISLCCLVLTAACAKNEVRIDISANPALSSAYRLLWLASSNSQSFYGETVISVQQGKGAVKIPTRYPTVVFLFRTSDSRPVSFFWAERGDKISITASSDNPAEWDIAGNTVNEELTAWRHANKAMLQRAAYEPDAANKAVADYVGKNPDSKVSTLLLLCVFDRSADEDQFARLWNCLDGDARDERLLNAVSRADFLDRETASPAALRNITMRSLKGKDTLRISRSKATLLYFSGFDSESPAHRDTLRALAKAFPDSSRRVIADIFLEPDSSLWRRTALRDSVAGLYHLWTPLSFSDPEVERLGVSRAGSFIVSDSKGKQLYRGRDAAKASLTFRREMHKR